MTFGLIMLLTSCFSSIGRMSSSAWWPMVAWSCSKVLAAASLTSSRGSQRAFLTVGTSDSEKTSTCWMNEVDSVEFSLSSQCFRLFPWTYRILAGGLHDLAEPDADALPLGALVWAQPVLQDGNDLWENFLPQLPHEVPECPSGDLKPQQWRRTPHFEGWFYQQASQKTNKQTKNKNSGFLPFSCQGRWKPGSPAGGRTGLGGSPSGSWGCWRRRSSTRGEKPVGRPAGCRSGPCTGPTARGSVDQLPKQKW